jgi:putative tricarboxylic transport membrane protein
MLISNGSLGIFYSNALVGSIVTLALIMLFWPLIGAMLDRVRGKKEGDEAPVA